MKWQKYWVITSQWQQLNVEITSPHTEGESSGESAYDAQHGLIFNFCSAFFLALFWYGVHEKDHSST